MTDRSGQQLGSYRLLRRLGSGAFAEVQKNLADRPTTYNSSSIDPWHSAADVNATGGYQHSGFDLFEELRVEGRGRERRIVFTTGDSISAQTRDHLLRSERPVLRKPFSLDELREMLDRVASD